jgi:hypothetical protein
MIDEKEIADTIQLFARLGDSLAIDFLLDDAKEMVDCGRRDMATRLLDLSDKFFRLRAEAMDEVGREADGLRVIGISLRIAAHRLHKAYGAQADDKRLLRLVHSSVE